MEVSVVEPTSRQEDVAVSYENGKILSFYQDAKKLYRGEMVVPKMLSVWSTAYCNEKCGYCIYAWTHGQGTSIDVPKFHRCIDEIAELGVESIEFAGGGEPLLHPKIWDFAKHTVERGMKVGTLTNGTKIDVGSIISYFSYVRIGVDSHNSDLYNKIRSPKAPGMFDVVMENTKALLEARGDKRTPKIGFKFLLGKMNYDYLDEFVALGKDIGVDYVHFKTEHSSETELNEYEREITEKRIKNLRQKFPKFVLGSAIRLRAIVPCFTAPIHSVMDSHGNLFICCFWNVPEKDSFGNALEEGFKKVWFSEKHWEFQRKYTVQDCDTVDCRWHVMNSEMKEIIENGKYDLAFV